MGGEHSFMGEIKNIKSHFDTPEMYNVFSNCLYMPTWDKFISEANEYMNNEAVNIFGYYKDNRIIGIIVIKNKNEMFEIKGIAVDSEFRKNGIGKKLIQYVCDELSISMLIAETDDDAVGFYKHCGFEAQKFTRTGDNGEYIRYKCILRTN